MLRFAQKSCQNEVNIPKLCVVGIQIRKYILRGTCVYRKKILIRNSKIQANYTAKVKVVRESPINIYDDYGRFVSGWYRLRFPLWARYFHTVILARLAVLTALLSPCK